MTPFDEWRSTTPRPGAAGCPIPRDHPLRPRWMVAWAYDDLSGPSGMLEIERVYWAELTDRSQIAADLTAAAATVRDATNPTSPTKNTVGSDNTSLRKGA